MNKQQTVNTFLQKRKYQFIILHLLFWFCIIAGAALFSFNEIKTISDLSGLAKYGLSGFFVFYPMRLLYKKYSLHRIGLTKLIPLTFIISFLTALILTVVTVFFNFPVLSHNPNLLLINTLAALLFSVIYFNFRNREDSSTTELQYVTEKERTKDAQLQMLRYQINPHFLFNTLSTLCGLIYLDQTKAYTMVVELSDILRYSLQKTNNDKVRLKDEFDIIEKYLKIEKLRFGSNLVVKMEIAPETHNALTPIFLLQPLVENAVVHGKKTSPLPLEIVLRTQLLNGNLVIEVENTGAWLSTPTALPGDREGGIGLKNVIERLRISYGAAHTFDIIKSTEKVRIIITLKGDVYE